MEPWIWAIVLIVALVVEFSTPQLVSIWFALGAVVALLLSILGVHLWVQIVAFVVVSLLLLIFCEKFWQNISKQKMKAQMPTVLLGKRMFY